MVERANNSPYGLHSAVFTQDITCAMRVAAKISAGTVCINCCAVLDPSVPFGGCRQSGWGRELGKVGSCWKPTIAYYVLTLGIERNGGVYRTEDHAHQVSEPPLYTVSFSVNHQLVSGISWTIVIYNMLVMDTLVLYLFAKTFSYHSGYPFYRSKPVVRMIFRCLYDIETPISRDRNMLKLRSPYSRATGNICST